MSPEDDIGLLQSADPVADGTLGTEDLDAVLDQLGAAITTHPARTHHRRLWLSKPRALMLAVVAVGAVAGGAAATGFLFKGDVREASPSFCRTALALSTDIPYPQGYGAWRTWVLVAELSVRHVELHGPCGSRTQGGRAVESRREIRGFFAMSAFCAWVYDWRQSLKTGDHSGAAWAAQEVAQATSWPAVRAEDPHPYDTGHGFRYIPHGRQETVFGWLLPFQSAVRRSDLKRVNDLIKSNYGTLGCSGFRPPPGSHDGTVLVRGGA